MSFISLRPSEAVETGFDDFEAKIETAIFSLFDYNGQQQERVALKIQFDAPAFATAMNPQFYTIGDPKDFDITNEGKSLVPKGSKTSLSRSANGTFFLETLVKAGFNEDKLSGNDITVIAGTLVHIVRQPNPHNNMGKGDSDKDKKNKGVLVVSKILDKIEGLGAANKSSDSGASSPSSSSSGPSASSPSSSSNGPSASAAPTPSASAAGNSVESDAVDAMLTILGNSGGSITRNGIPKVAAGVVAQGPNRVVIMSLVFKEDFLSAAGRPWTYDAGTKTISL